MSVSAYNHFLAVLALLALGGAAVLLVPAVRSRLRAAGFAELGPWLAVLVATVATAGSLIYSEVVGFEPCRLCWYQRIAMYPLVPILAVGASRRDPGLRWYALPLSVTGGLIAAYHYLVQVYPTLEGTACSVGTPCAVRLVEVFGFVSIPFMAFSGFLAITVLVGLYPVTRGES